MEVLFMLRCCRFLAEVPPEARREPRTLFSVNPLLSIRYLCWEERGTGGSNLSRLPVSERKKVLKKEPAPRRFHLSQSHQSMMSSFVPDAPPNQKRFLTFKQGSKSASLLMDFRKPDRLLEFCL